MAKQFVTMAKKIKLPLSKLEALLMGAHDILHGNTDESKFKEYNLGMLLLKRLSTKFDCQVVITTKQLQIAFEFATLGMSGIDPSQDCYSIPAIKDKKFSGYQTLVYYYVSWAIAIPEMLSQLQMPFGKEYELANKLAEL